MSRLFPNKLLARLLLALGLAAAGPALANGYSNMYVFGDSLSDSGNVYALTGGFPPAPYVDGHFSNGPTYAEELAGKLGLTATASLLGGTNYAFGGATAAAGSEIGGFATDLNSQVNSFRALSGAADANALYVVWAGANDLRANPDAAGIGGALNGISTAISGLYTEGARNFLVMNLPNLGLTPESTSAGTSAGASFLSATYNSFLDATLGGLGSGLAGINIRGLDTYSLLNTVVANPAAYGLTNVTDNCLAAGAACTPESYLFWDNIHPTAIGHRIIADAAFAVVAVPEPETYAMMLMGLGLLGLVARRRKLQAA